MRCPNCQSEIPDGKRFCGYCGQRLEPAAPADDAFDEDAPTRVGARQTPEPPPPPSEPPVAEPVQVVPAPEPAVPETAQVAPVPEHVEPAPAERSVPSVPPSTTPTWKCWLAALLAGLGLVIAEMIAWAMFDAGLGRISVYPVIGALTGLFLGVILWWALRPSMPWFYVLIISAGWVAAETSRAVVDTIGAETLSAEWCFLRIASAVVGGLVIGLAARRAEPAVRWSHVARTGIVWGVAWSLGLVITVSMDFEQSASWAIGSGIAAALGCGATVWLTYRARLAPPPTLEARPGGGQTPAVPHAAGPVEKLWLVMLLAGLGGVIVEVAMGMMWDAGFGSMLNYPLQGILIGLLLGAILWWAVRPSMPWPSALILLAGWGAAETIRAIGVGVVGAEFLSTEWFSLSTAAAALGGLVSGLVLRWGESSIRWSHVAIIAVAWGIAKGMSYVVAAVIGFDFGIAWWMGSGIATAAGCGATVWLLARTRSNIE